MPAANRSTRTAARGAAVAAVVGAIGACSPETEPSATDFSETGHPPSASWGDDGLDIDTVSGGYRFQTFTEWSFSDGSAYRDELVFRFSDGELAETHTWTVLDDDGTEACWMQQHADGVRHAGLADGFESAAEGIANVVAFSWFDVALEGNCAGSTTEAVFYLSASEGYYHGFCNLADCSEYVTSWFDDPDILAVAEADAQAAGFVSTGVIVLEWVGEFASTGTVYPGGVVIQRD